MKALDIIRISFLKRAIDFELERREQIAHGNLQEAALLESKGDELRHVEQALHAQFGEVEANGAD